MSGPSWFKKLFQSNKSKTGIQLKVMYEDTLVGTLFFDGESFVFEYDRECPNTLRISGLDHHINKTRHLPPFFSARLPSESRPEIRKAIELIGNSDPIQILGHLSKKSPVSPYQFVLKKKGVA